MEGPPLEASPSPAVWREAEERVEEMLYVFQPTVVSQDTRNEVIEYVQTIIGSCIGAQLFPFGSMPLRTYLPDGDIDLTVLCNQSTVDDLIRGICRMVDDRRNDREFQIKDIRIVEAQVKILKFTAKSIAVDLSFNQVAGLGALCFLEQVDRMIGREHLLKRSIILIKAWCLYESRILGAHIGLISTYCLEIMVLYIINVFHSSLNGPLAVLYKFLDYFGKFDWQSQCISLCGPVPISSSFSSSPSADDTNEKLLLGKDFIDACSQLFSSPIMEIKPRPFQVKYLNVVDPLKDTNNLGRSVSKGNFFRIKYAFSYGSQKLGEILMLPMVRMGRELEKFFRNTLDRNGKGERLDVEDTVPAFGTGRFVSPSMDGEIHTFYSNLMYSQWQFGYGSGQNYDARWDALNKFVSEKCMDDASVPILQPCILRRPFEETMLAQPARHTKGTGTFIPIMQSRPPFRRNPVWARSRSNVGKPCIVDPCTKGKATSFEPIVAGEDCLVEMEDESSSKATRSLLLHKSYHLEDEMEFPPLSL